MNELEKICIYDPAGANYLLGREWEFPITDKCERSAKVMGDDFVHLVFESTHKVVFDAFSFIRYKGQTFFLREKYIPKPKGTFKEDSGDVSTAYYSYDVKFVSVANMLDKYVCYRHVVVSGDKGGEWNEPEININGNLETMYKIIMGSIQQVAERLSDHMEFTSMLKTIPANGLTSDGSINTKKVKLTAGTKLLTFNFSGDKIANVCTTVANNFTNDDKKDTEWYITEDNGSLTLHFSKYVDEEYGVQYVSDYISNNNGADSSAHPQKSGGLKDVDYAQEWSGITNVIVPYGSTRNMTYQAAKGIDEVTQMQSTFGKRLRLKPNTYYYVQNKDGKEVSFLTDKQGAVRNTSVDTGIEEVRFYDEIYPQGHFKVTSVKTKNKRQDGEIVPEYTVAGVAIDSNGNEIQPAEGFYPIAIEEGTTLSVRFEKGLLNGREFEIANKTRKDEGRTTYSLKFTIVADGSLEDGTLIPSGNFIPREGDEFALFNMKMPEVYITAAEHELAQRVYTDLEEAVSKRPEIKCTSDPTTWDKEMALGYQFQVKSEKFNSEDTFVSRVISYSYKLTKPKEIQFNLASAIMQGTLSHMNDLIVDVTNQAGGLEQRAINLSRRGWRDAAEMAEMVDSLAADMMLVGNEKYQFAFTAGIEIVNSNNQTTAIKIGEGTLQHTQDPYISDYTCQGWWSHGAVTLNNGHTENGSASLVSLPDTPFYLYAVVGQNSDNISFELQDKEQDGEAYLLLGILSSAFMDTISGVTTNYRVFNRTNGYTQISGGTITTEQIQDPGRNLIIDFLSKRIIARNGAEIIGNIKFKASDEKTAEEQLAELGIDVGKAQQAAEDEAEKVRKEYKAAIAESEDKMTEALAASVVEINGGIEALQKQVDGEVNSWFMEGEPTTTNKPASDWTGTDENGVAFDYRQRHDGDTYTDISEITLLTSDMWEQGNISNLSSSNKGYSYDSQKYGNNGRFRSKSLMDNKPEQTIYVPAGYHVCAMYYDANGLYLGTYSDNIVNFKLKQYTNSGLLISKIAFLVYHKTNTTNLPYTLADELKLSINPTAGQSWRWCNVDDEYGTGWHWHKIADSDAVKALQEAAKAQSTADGKSTTFIEEPKNYDIGDLWILAADRTLNGNTYKQGTILTANAASATFVASHWSEKVKYIDESIARQQAQQALDGLELGGENIARGTKDMELSSQSAWSKGTWRKTSYSTNIDLSDDPFSIVEQGVRITCNTTNAATQVAQDKATIPFQVGDKIIISCYVKPSIEGLQLECQPIWAFHDNTSSMAGMKRQRLTLGRAGEWQKVVFDNMGSITIANNSQSLAYFYAIGATTEYVDICAVKVERGNKSTAWSPAPADVDSKADAIKAIADGAAESAKQSNDQLANMSNDSILTPQEKGSVADEWACIKKEYTQNSTNKTAAWGSATVAEWTAYNTAYTTLQTYVSTLALTDRNTNTTIVKSTFQANFANYYSANVAFLNALSKKVAELEVAAMEIGGRNLAIYSTAYGANCKKNGDYGFVQTTADTNTKFDLKIQPYLNNTYGGYALVRTDIVKVGVYKFNVTLTKDCDRLYIATNGAKLDTISRFYLKETIPSGTELVISLEITNITQGSFSWKNVMIAKGTKATDWTPAPEDVDAAIAAVDSKAQALEYLKTALEDGSTEIAGGLTMTNVLMLKNLAGDVTAGMSGLTTHENKEDKVLMWGGGTYEEAYAAANNDTYNTGSRPTTLLKKDGTGKIGAFWIDKDTVKVVSGEQTTFITNKSISDVVSKQSTNEISKATKSYSSQTDKTEGSKTAYNTIYSKSFSVAKGKYALRGNLSVDLLEAFVVGTSTPYTNDFVYAQAYVGGLRIRVVQSGVTKATLTGSCNANNKWYGYASSSYPNGTLKQEITGSITSGKIVEDISEEFELSAGTVYINIEAIYYGIANLNGKSGNVSYVISFSYNAKLLGLDKYSVIAKDGIGIIANSDAQFYVENSDSSRYLRVIANGLPVVTSQTKLNSLSKGQLYIEGGNLKIKT